MTVTAGVITRAVIFEDRPQPKQDDPLDRLGELEQQIQVALSGYAAPTIAWADVDITFDVEFLDATGQRYSNIVEPAFTHGAKIDSEDGPVIVTSVVTAYATDDRGVIVGASVSIGALSGSAATIAFTGYANLVWQGYGSVPNEPADPDFTP